MEDGKYNTGISVGKGRGRKIQNENSDKDLRRPFDYDIETSSSTLPTSNPVVDSQPDIISGLDGLKIQTNVCNSSLSAEAAEFVPMSCQVNSGVNSAFNIQDRQIQQQVHSDLSNLFCPQEFYISHPVVIEVNDLVVKLTLKPQKYDSIATQLTSIIYRACNDPDLLKEVTSVIFEQAVGEANFRYNGGRLCQHLVRNVASDQISFKALLLKRCQYEHSMAGESLKTNPERLYGFTLFLADIFVHLLTPAGHYLQSLKSGLCELLILLISHCQIPSLKCVAQVLKCCGYLLDAEQDVQFDAIMSMVRDVAVTQKAPEHIGSLLLSVVELRAAQWGRATSSNLPAGTDKSELQSSNNGPRGRQPEEDSSSDSDDPYYSYTAGEECDGMDAEMAQDFEEFLLGQQQQQQQQK